MALASSQVALELFQVALESSQVALEPSQAEMLSLQTVPSGESAGSGTAAVACRCRRRPPAAGRAVCRSYRHCYAQTR